MKTAKEHEYFITGKSNSLLRSQGYCIRRAESYNAWTQRKKDLYGFIDVAALHPEVRGVTGVQITTYSNLSAHIKKAESLPAFWLWLDCGNPVIFHAWQKKKQGNRELWIPKIVNYVFEDILS